MSVALKEEKKPGTNKISRIKSAVSKSIWKEIEGKLHLCNIVETTRQLMKVLTQFMDLPFIIQDLTKPNKKFFETNIFCSAKNCYLESLKFDNIFFYFLHYFQGTNATYRKPRKSAQILANKKLFIEDYLGLPR